jgi:hypothetical protein
MGVEEASSRGAAAVIPMAGGRWSMTVVMRLAMTAPNQGRPPPGDEIVTPGACTAEEKKQILDI